MLTYTQAWEKNIIDADTAVDIFYRTCFDADSACPLRQSGDTSFADMRARIDALIQSLEQAPVSAIYNNRAYLVTSAHVSEKIRTGLYTPIIKYEPLAHSLAAALTGNFSTILSDTSVMPFDQRAGICTEPPATIPPPLEAYTFANEATSGILCADSLASAGTRDLTWAQSVVSTLVNQSRTSGEGWAQVPLVCANWPASLAPPYTFSGPFGSPAPNNDAHTPEAPMLILSTRTDHVTPLANAYALSRRHGGAVVVVEETVGHCALLSATSECVHAIVREYFHTGTVPVNGTACEAECAVAIPRKDCPGLPVIE
jgi:pimeloyl-ACP methyl ester carboxylesterase